MTTRLDDLTPTLVQQIVHDLSSLELCKTVACRLIHYLIRLDRPELARDTFLKTRRAVMLKRVRSIRAEGDISIYISELAIVCFTILRHTSDWYMSAFKENRMASGRYRHFQLDYMALTGRIRDVGKRSGRDVRRHVQASSVRLDHWSRDRRRVHQSHCLSQSQGEHEHTVCFLGTLTYPC